MNCSTNSSILYQAYIASEKNYAILSIINNGIFTVNSTTVFSLMGLTLVGRLILYYNKKMKKDYNDVLLRNKLIYYVEILFTTISLLTILPFYHMFFNMKLHDFMNDSNAFTLTSISIGMLTSLYLFEALYKPKMGWALMVHHYSTLIFSVFISTFVKYLYEDNILSGVMPTEVSLLLMATTEQPIFIGMLTRRADKHKISYFMFIYALFHTLVVKLPLAIYSLVEFIRYNHMNFLPAKYAISRIFIIFVPVILIATVLSQLFVCKVYMYLIKSSYKRMKNITDDTVLIVEKPSDIEQQDILVDNIMPDTINRIRSTSSSSTDALTSNSTVKHNSLSSVNSWSSPTSPVSSPSSSNIIRPTSIPTHISISPQKIINTRRLKRADTQKFV
jgi:hypothetical protein